MKGKVAILVFTILVGVGRMMSQNTNGEEIFVKSWREGADRVSEYTLEIRLSDQNQEFKQVIFGKSGTKYMLIIKHIPAADSALSGTGNSIESWQAELRMLNLKKGSKHHLGENLLRVEGVGPGGDNFPREDLAGYLYPKITSNIRVNGIPLTDGFQYYPLSTKRKVQVESFFVTIKVLDYKLNLADSHEVDFLDVRIDFKNK